MNALLGAITAQDVSVHVYEPVYFGGVFGTIFFLNLALVGASVLVAAICGTSRSSTATCFILGMIIAVRVPLIVQSVACAVCGVDHSRLPSAILPRNQRPEYAIGIVLA
jgi:hypothetical protein